MKSPNFPKVWFIAALLLSPTVAGITLTRSSSAEVHASSSSEAGRRLHRKSDDLQFAVNNRAAREFVSVIIETTTSDDNLAFNRLVAQVIRTGGRVHRSLSNNRHLAVRVPADAIDSLANDASVNYISLDRAIQVTGHLETTTGADQARRSGSASAIDGAGIGIAILDWNLYRASRFQRQPGGCERRLHR